MLDTRASTFVSGAFQCCQAAQVGLRRSASTCLQKLEDCVGNVTFRVTGRLKYGFGFGLGKTASPRCHKKSS